MTTAFELQKAANQAALNYSRLQQKFKEASSADDLEQMAKSMNDAWQTLKKANFDLDHFKSIREITQLYGI